MREATPGWTSSFGFLLVHFYFINYRNCSLGFEIRSFLVDSDPTIKSLETDSNVGSKIADPILR